MSKFLADENVPRDAVQSARATGIDLTWIKELMPGANDESVLAMSVAEERVLVTFDKDFGALAFQRGATASCGIILFRLRPSSAEYLSRFVVAVLSSSMVWAGHFSVAEQGRLRVIPLK